MDYWDSIAKKQSTGKQINDNWWKRQKLIHHLMRYDFTRKKIIEIGCGLGVTANAIRSIVGIIDEYLGVDISPEFLRVAKEVFKLNVKEGRITEIPAEDSSYDCMLLLDVLEHVKNAEREQAASEISRVLKESAKVFINNPITESAHNPSFDFGFNSWNIGCLCDDAGFEIEEISTYEVFPPGQSKRYMYQFIVLTRG